MNRFTIPEGSICAVHDRAEGQSYHLTDPKEALSLVELLNGMNEICGKYFSSDTSNTQVPNQENPS